MTKRFYIVSGIREGSIFYGRCNFPSVPEGVIDCFSLTYAAQEKAAWAPIVPRPSSSLRAGRGIEPRR